QRIRYVGSTRGIAQKGVVLVVAQHLDGWSLAGSFVGSCRGGSQRGHDGERRCDRKYWAQPRCSPSGDHAGSGILDGKEGRSGSVGGPTRGFRRLRSQAIGKSMISPTMEDAVTMTRMSGSLKLRDATTIAAAMFRWDVASPSTAPRSWRLIR